VFVAVVVPVVVAAAAAAAGVTQIEFVASQKSRSYFDLRLWELMVHTVECWVEWEGLSVEGGQLEQEPSTPQARWHVQVRVLESFVAWMKQQLLLLLAAGQLQVLAIGLFVLALSLCLEDETQWQQTEYSLQYNLLIPAHFPEYDKNFKDKQWGKITFIEHFFKITFFILCNWTA
jgi:hypothetical protein